MPSNQTFQKRQKEMARKERQKAKAERKAQRKLEKQSAPQAAVEQPDHSGEDFDQASDSA